MLSSLVFPDTGKGPDDDTDSAFDMADTRLSVMGIISFIPYFNWLVNLFFFSFLYLDFAIITVLHPVVFFFLILVLFVVFFWNYQSWVFAWLDTGKRRYAVYALVYLVPYLRYMRADNVYNFVS